ncbi:hypothetical protein K1719_039375 [Acacia pycnantha]|nr:hypothetical protein K1719_039375 [Acacia pycnantha]
MSSARSYLTEMPPTRVVSLLQCDCRSNNWSICVKLVGHFWDIPSQRRHKHLSYNAVITDAEVTMCSVDGDDGDILFSSHCELSKARFNYNHPAVIAFHSSLDRAVADNVTLSPDSTTA